MITRYNDELAYVEIQIPTDKLEINTIAEFHKEVVKSDLEKENKK